MVIDGDPFVTHGTFGVPALGTFVGNDLVLGLTSKTRFDRLTLVGHYMVAFAVGTIRLAMTQRAVIRGPGTAHVIPTVKMPGGSTAIPLAGMMSAIIGVDPFSQSTQ